MARASIIWNWHERPDWWTVGLASGLTVLFWAIGASKELWFDERFVEVVASRSIGDLFGLLKFENNPPWIFVLTHGWKNIFGGDPAMLRMLTLVPTLASLFVMRRFAADLFGRATAAVAVGLLAVSGQVVIQSLELRMYPWVMLWSALGMWLTWKYAQTMKSRDLVWLSVVHVLGLYTHYTYGFILIGTAIWLLVRIPDRRRVVAMALVSSGLLFLPWLVLSVWEKLTDLSTNVGIQRIAADRWEAIRLPVDFIVPSPLQSDHLWLTGRVVTGIMIGLAALVFWLRLRQRQERSAVMYLLIVSGLAAAGLVITGIVVPKYASILIVPIVLIISHGLRRTPAPVVARVGAATALIIVAAAFSFEHARQPYVTYTTAGNVIASAEQPDDVILIYPFNDTIAFAPTYQGRLLVHGFFPLKDPADTSIHDIVRYNFRVTLTPENVDRLSAYVGNASRVWFLFDVPPGPGYWHGDLIAGWFREHGYQVTQYTEIFRNVPPLLVRYDKLGT